VLKLGAFHAPCYKTDALFIKLDFGGSTWCVKRTLQIAVAACTKEKWRSGLTYSAIDVL
jgi:hypothetical protein